MERFTFPQAPRQVLRLANQEVHRKIPWHGQPDFHCLILLISARHHDKDIDVAILVRRSIGMRSKEDDLVRLKALGHLACEFANHAHGDLIAAIPTT
jgi:hypothetical protein